MIFVKKNSDKITNHLKQSSTKFHYGARKGFDINGQMLVKSLRHEMTRGRKTGRTYKIYRGIGGRALKRPRLHVASTKDEFPAVITGKLRQSVDYRVLGSTKMRFGAGDGSMEYAKILEARNEYLKKTFINHKNQFKTNLNRQIKKALGFK